MEPAELPRQSHCAQYLPIQVAFDYDRGQAWLVAQRCIICGFAINDTVDTTGVKQYEQIYQYDLMVVANDDDAAAMRKQVAQDGRATETLNLRVDSGEMSNAAQESETVQLMTVPNNSLNKLNDMVTLEEAGDDGWFELPNIFGKAGGGTVALDDSGVIVAKSAANSLDIHAGDTVTLSNGGRRRAKVEGCGGDAQPHRL